MSAPSNGTGLREHVLLFSRFLRSPRTVGAVTASSRALAEAMLEGLDLQGPGRIIELGPGTGAFTAAIVERLGPDANFLAIDIDPEFVRRIQKRWPDIACICESGGRSIHALVRVDADSKASWDALIQKVKPALVTLGADPGALSAVRLTRLPQARRGERVQRLLYLNPAPDGTPIVRLGGAVKGQV